MGIKPIQKIHAMHDYKSLTLLDDDLIAKIDIIRFIKPA
jgi:hypothetical protein